MDENKMLEMQKQIDMLTQLLGGKVTNSTNSVDSYIDFESTSLSPMYLSTGGNGKGDTYVFEHFGDIQGIPLVDAKEIVRHNKPFIQEGLVYIKDEGFVESENLKKYYNGIIGADAMRNLLLCKRATFGERFGKLTNTQRMTVCGLLFDKIKSGKEVDEEILFYINQSIGRDLKVEAENLQLLIDNNEK